ncbi:MAG: diaminopimelate decarboxylase [Deltaproteobacteria bacterium]|nr:diaminopimelate decarboxylase [Deltaproteobacteria bacterium]
MPDSFVESVDLQAIARRVGTPFFICSAEVLRRRISDILQLTNHPHLQARYAMKAYSTRRVLEAMRRHGLWIDAVSGNEVLRARAAGFAIGVNPPAVLFSADVFRDNALAAITECDILPNIGSPGMIADLQSAGWRGPIGMRLNPGFGHGHVSECDTGGPSSKHGIWHDDAGEVRRAAERAGYDIVLLHAHVGSGPAIDEFTANTQKLAHFFAERVRDYPALAAVSFGGGLPHPYRPDGEAMDLGPLGRGLREAQALLSARAGRALRVEIEPGRYFVAPSTALITRVSDVKATRSNDKGPGHTFVMVDAGFVDLVRPAMYGSYHHITVHGADARAPQVPVIVAGPLCESGDVFTRGADELLAPRPLPLPRPGDLLVLHDAGAYGVAMSSNYTSVSRAPQVWLEDGDAYLMARRETLADIVRVECFERL